MEFKDLSPEQMERAAGKSPEEIIALAKAEGVELSQAQLEDIAGGGWFPDSALEKGCPKCGSKDVHVSSVGQTMVYTCNACGHKWM